MKKNLKKLAVKKISKTAAVKGGGKTHAQAGFDAGNRR